MKRDKIRRVFAANPDYCTLSRSRQHKRHTCASSLVESRIGKGGSSELIIRRVSACNSFDEPNGVEFICKACFPDNDLF